MHHDINHSRFAQRIRRRYAAQLDLLPERLNKISTENMLECLAALESPPFALELEAALRVLRHLVVLRLLERDCSGAASVEEVTATMTDLAELVLELATQRAHDLLQPIYGSPQNQGGQEVQMWIVGMGKLGARELNVSSDIDLVYVYESEGKTNGEQSISNEEYFGRVVKIIYQLIGQVSEHGQVFRIDLALRPHGSEGATAISLPALENYLKAHGREWERFAWLKSRVVAPRSCVSSPNVQALRLVVLPFVFRRYLDYSVFEALRQLHRQIRQHASRRSSGQPGRSKDVKLSAGGIRELEFIVQLLQVVRGGQYPELRCRPTLAALERLARAQLLPSDTADQLAQAYRFLRQVEHRIQYLDDQQTHVLPTDENDLDWIAWSMGLENACALLNQLDVWRECVAQEFDALLGNGSGACNCSGVCFSGNGNSNANGSGVAEHGGKGGGGGSQPLVPQAQARRNHLLARTKELVEQGKVSISAAEAFSRWLEPLLRRQNYLALLIERPMVHERLLGLLHLLGTPQSWPVRYLQRHPGVIDTLADPDLLQGRFNPNAFEERLETSRQALRSTGEDDDEALLNLLRRAHHEQVFRTLVRDVEGAISVEQVADDLSALAQSVLSITSRWCWDRISKDKGGCESEARFAIIGYGKLGGKELGYGSDLDIVFVFDDEQNLDHGQAIYSAFARKLISWLSVKTGEGDLFEIDTQLRPNGNSGLLVSSFAAYADYQLQRGSNTAWTWEHQAMTRARFIVGQPYLQERFEAVRRGVMTAARNPDDLKREILEMRQRLHEARLEARKQPRPGQFDLKHSAGAMLDAEFALQYLLLLHTRAHPQLLENLGTIALLIQAEELGLVPQNVGRQAASAYRQMRRLQHLCRLNAQKNLVDTLTIAPYRDAILALWQAVFVCS